MPHRARDFPADESGVALAGALLAIIILTVVVAGGALATMGETAHAVDQSLSLRALHLAEAGAYRALGELRRRLAVDLDAGVGRAAPQGIAGPCQANEAWRLIATYAGPGWTDDGANRRAVLAVGTPDAPVEVRGARSDTIGAFFATIYVRPAGNATPGSNVCISSGSGAAESYQMRFDYFVAATAATRQARRTVCLKNPGNGATCAAWLASADPGASRWDSLPPTHGWLVLIEPLAGGSRDREAGYAAPRWPRISDDALYDRPIWEELIGR